MPVQIIGEPQQFITNLAIILRNRGEQELQRRIDQLNRYNLLRLVPNGANIPDRTLRFLVSAAVHTRLDRLNGFQAEVEEWTHRDDMYEEQEEAREDGIIFGHDTGSKYHGGKTIGRKQLRELARMAFAHQKHVIQKELKEWNKDIDLRNKEGLG